MLAEHPDPTVDHVLKTWAPRMIVQGIDYNDLMTTAARIGTWDDWCREWCVTAAGHEEFARKAEAAGSRESATEAYLMASMAYHFGCNNSPHDLDQYIPAAKKRVECYAKAAPYLNPPESCTARCTLEGLASKIRCPLLAVHGTHDFVPVEQAKRIYDEASGVKQWLLLEGGNHVCNNLPFRYRPATWDFLGKHLRAGAPA
jgi:pimeloyl-ACP methyl ester carboxylesterase